MARPINTSPIVLRGKEAKEVLSKTKQKDITRRYKQKMDDHVKFYQEVEAKSGRAE